MKTIYKNKKELTIDKIFFSQSMHQIYNTLNINYVKDRISCVHNSGYYNK